MVRRVAEREIQVASFPGSANPTTHTITLQVQDMNVMQGCSCPDFVASHSVCKHMYLANRIEMVLFPQDIRGPAITNRASATTGLSQTIATGTYTRPRLTEQDLDDALNR
jgi:hypothetical protein